MQAWEYIIAGSLVGGLVGATGVGGGSLMTPILLLFFGVNPSVAVGTDLVFASITKTAGTGAHQLRAQIRWDVVRLLATGSVPGVLAGLLLLSWIGDQSTAAKHYITALVGASVLFTGVVTVGGDLIRAKLRIPFASAPSALPVARTVGTGAIIGMLVALTSIGAGALCALALLWLYRDSMTTAERVGTDVAHAIPVTLVAGAGHAWMGHLDLAILGQLLLGSIPFVLLGAYAASKVPDKVLRLLLGSVLIAVGIKLFL